MGPDAFLRIQKLERMTQIIPETTAAGAARQRDGDQCEGEQWRAHSVLWHFCAGTRQCGRDTTEVRAHMRGYLPCRKAAAATAAVNLGSSTQTRCPRSFWRSDYVARLVEEALPAVAGLSAPKVVLLGAGGGAVATQLMKRRGLTHGLNP